MKHPVVEITSAATLRVPQRHWLPLLRVLANYHQIRCKEWADEFITDTKRCPLADLLHKKGSELPAGTAGWLARAWENHLDGFKGTLRFWLWRPIP